MRAFTAAISSTPRQAHGRLVVEQLGLHLRDDQLLLLAGERASVDPAVAGGAQLLVAALACR